MENTSEDTACGPGATFCRGSARTDYQTVLKSDSCAIQADAMVDESIANYRFWLPKYRRDETCQRSGYQNCRVDANRFGPRKITQESFLQGRGQVTTATGCPGGRLTYLPEALFKSEDEEGVKKPPDMYLYAQPTKLGGKSCGTVSEIDTLNRMKPLPGPYNSSFSPFSGAMGPKADLPTVANRRVVRTLGMKNKYPTTQELFDASRPYQ